MSGAAHWKTLVERAQWAGEVEPMNVVACLAGVGSPRKIHATFSPAPRNVDYVSGKVGVRWA